MHKILMFGRAKKLELRRLRTERQREQAESVAGKSTGSWREECRQLQGVQRKGGEQRQWREQRKERAEARERAEAGRVQRQVRAEAGESRGRGEYTSSSVHSALFPALYTLPYLPALYTPCLSCKKKNRISDRHQS
jgi:hypothetical protein